MFKDDEITILNDRARQLLGDRSHQGGCFGTGSGKLNLPGSNPFLVNFTSTGMNSGITYIFKVSVTSDDGKHDQVSTSVELVHGNPPAVFIV